jgi:hypothetical protein
LSDPFRKDIINIYDRDLLFYRDLSQRSNADTGSFKRYIRIRFAGIIYYTNKRVDSDAKEFVFDYKIEHYIV